jgi:ubiquinone/menaquinone biosynthesis C-methylase UbiE
MIERIETRDRKKVSDFYDDIYSTGGYDNPVKFIDSVIRLIPGDGVKVLDVACGNGNFLARAEKKFKTYGVDISPAAIKLASKKLRSTDLRVASATKLPFKRGSFDAVTCLGSLEHFPDMDKSLEEMKRVVKDDGLVIIHVPNSRYLVHMALRIDSQGQINERLATEGEWREILEKHFAVKKVFKYNTKWFLEWIPKKYCCHFTFLCQKK